MTVRILTGDCREVLRGLPEESVHCVVTSPPYWGLRCYGVDGQLGQEPTLDEHIDVMVEVFREVRRVLRKDGTLWLNYGDCYATSANGRSAADTKAVGKDDRTFRDKPFSTVTNGLKPKDLCMMPARIALALQADGWWIRSEIIWAKLNPMPESITDRPTSSHEKIYLLAKSARYFFDAEAVREKSDWNGTSGNKNYRPWAEDGRIDGGMNSGDSSGRNIRNIWTIATAPFPDAHFATFPPALVEPCIKAGTSEKGCCPECGAPWVREVERESTRSEVAPATVKGALRADGGGHYRANSTETGGVAGLVETRTIGWRPSCGCFCIEPGGKQVPHFPKPCMVLDPFGGAGTVGLVADRLKRDAILIELNPDYAVMARERVQNDAGMFAEVSTA